MKLKSIHIENIKCFQDYTLDLLKPGTQEPLNTCVLVGPNGCGKSTIMEAIVSAMTTADPDYGGKILGSKALKYGAKNATIKLRFSLNEKETEAFASDSNEFSITNIKLSEAMAESAGYENVLVFPEELWEDGKSEEERARIKEGQESYQKTYDLFANSDQTGCILYFDAFRYLPTTNPSGINTDIIPNVRKDSLRCNVGSDNAISNKYFNVKQWLLNLDYLRLKEEGTYYKRVYDHILQALELLFQPLNALEIDTSGNILFQDNVTKEKIDFDLLSDGFKNLFSIIGAISMRLSVMGESEEQPFYMNEAIVLIDEIDCHIHPKWQKNIIPGLKRLFPNCQYIVSTHSPYILSSVQEYEILQIGEKKIV